MRDRSVRIRERSVLTIDGMSTNAVATTTIVQGVPSDSTDVPGAESLGAKSDRSSDMGMDRSDEIAFRSLMVGDVNCLKGEVRALRTELASLKSEMQVTPRFRDAHSADSAGNFQGNTCSLYVRLRGMFETCVGWNPGCSLNGVCTVLSLGMHLSGLPPSNF